MDTVIEWENSDESGWKEVTDKYTLGKWNPFVWSFISAVSGFIACCMLERIPMRSSSKWDTTQERNDEINERKQYKNN